MEAESRKGSSGNRDDSSEHGLVCAFSGAAAAPAPPGIAGRFGQMISALRNDRRTHFPGALGTESGWAVILQLYAAHVDQHRLHISTLIERTGVPGTTVLRALETLVSAGFVTRSEDRFDRRRVVVELSATGVEAMNRYLQSSGARAVFL